LSQSRPATAPNTQSKSRPSSRQQAASIEFSPKKKLRYIPGGAGGGGRYIDSDGEEIVVGGTGPGGSKYTGPKGKVGQENAAEGVNPVVSTKNTVTTVKRSQATTEKSGRFEKPHKRDTVEQSEIGGSGDKANTSKEGGNASSQKKDTTQKKDKHPATRTRIMPPREKMTFESSAQAAASSQNDSYKPREERGYEEFHPDLDLNAKLQVFSAKEVDGVPPSKPSSPTPQNGQANGGTSLNSTETPESAEVPTATPARNLSATPGTSSGVITTRTPAWQNRKRGPGRPPRDPATFYANRAAQASGTPNTPKILPISSMATKERLTLPQPSFRKVDTPQGSEETLDKDMIEAGYQGSDVFKRPETLIRYNGPLLEDGQVEYDMDRVDHFWLEAHNAERVKLKLRTVSHEIFEITITKIELEWSKLEKRIPKPNPKPPQTQRPRSSSAAAVNGEVLEAEEPDSKCAICDDGDCENTNAIVFCDGCDLAVHQECYGVPFIPEGQWLCRKCQLIGRGIPTCIFCPNTDGGFKQTNSSRWAHLLCAMWIPEVSLGNHIFMEPIMDVEKVPKPRWKLVCYICNQKMGACIQCCNSKCYLAFHVTCARRAKLFLQMKNTQGLLIEMDGNAPLKALCDKHCPAEYAQENKVEEATKAAKAFYKRTMKGRIWADSQESALAIAASHAHTEHTHDHFHGNRTHGNHALTDNNIVEEPPSEQPPDKDEPEHVSYLIGESHKTHAGAVYGCCEKKKPIWKLPSGAPVIPHIVLQAVVGSLKRYKIQQCEDWVAEVCRYWTLKREARRGAALIKRLQSQMDTWGSMDITRRDFAAMGGLGRERLKKRLEFAKTLYEDIKKQQELSHLVVLREAQKLEKAKAEVNIVHLIWFPLRKFYVPIMDKAIEIDLGGRLTPYLLSFRTKVANASVIYACPIAGQMRTFVFKAAYDRCKTMLPASPPASVETYNAAYTKALEECKKVDNAVRKVINAILPMFQKAARVEAQLLKKDPDVEANEVRKKLTLNVTREMTWYLGFPKKVDANGVARESSVANQSVANQSVANQDSTTPAASAPDMTADAEGDVEMTPVDDASAAANQIAGEAARAASAGRPLTPGQATSRTAIATAAANEAAAATRASATAPSASPTFSPPASVFTFEVPSVMGSEFPESARSTMSPNPSAEPQTPEHNFLSEGGLPWYLQEPHAVYDPKTKTLTSPKVKAAEEMDGSDDELSELDDDGLSRLEDSIMEGMTAEEKREKVRQERVGRMRTRQPRNVGKAADKGGK
jgi:NuA3 HAT complex component NTO1